MKIRHNKQEMTEQADRLDRYRREGTADGLEPGLAELADALAAEERSEQPDSTFVAGLGGRIEQQAAAMAPRRRRLRPHAGVWAGAAALGATLLVAGVLLALQPGRETRVASAAEILERAHVASESADAAGIQSLVVEQSTVTYYLGDDLAGTPSARSEYRVWYQAPDRQRVENEYIGLSPEGATVQESSTVLVWDGEEYWTYDTFSDEVHWLRQDPDADIYLQGVSRGAAPAALANLYTFSCRSAVHAGEAEVAGRTADIVELGRPTCGMAFPGGDGRLVVWVDQETGLVLKFEQYTVNGRLAAVREVTAIEINGTLDESVLTFVPPEGAHVEDLRDQPVGVGFTRGWEQPPSITLEEANEEATFPVRAPRSAPRGFKLESVEHYWGSPEARELRSHADWVLLRYADDDGNWLLVSQGFGGGMIAARHLSSPPPPEEYTGTIQVNGASVNWVQGYPRAAGEWEPDVMASLGWRAGRFGDGWAMVDGERVIGSPLYVGLASNVLSIEELAEVASSFD